MTFYQQFMSIPPPERERIVTASGMSIAYVNKNMYVSAREPVFKFHNAVELERHSNGLLPFCQHTAGQVDWAFVRTSLNRSHRMGAF